ncbi:TonB-dependent receptor [Rhodoferax sp.]|uniref:TonB-dependent receptor n=1 Tax=Rhodoferax sp. TaxID=50421 RepID=UPI002754A800|nr:TonB-dependent receptor [Rhodoferax sp.]
MRSNRLAVAVSSALSVLSLSWSHTSLAQGVATDAQLKAVVITASAMRSPLDPNLPNSTASRTAEQLQEQNLFNPEDALERLPSLTVRKRFLGDRNANLAGRSYGTLQPGRSLVYLDGYLISNFLGRFDAPRWNMINEQSIERVDALYGPFSAIYPGNSIGTTVVISERKPRGFEASASIKFNSQPFSEYGTDETYVSSMTSARVASRLASGFWYAVAVQHQDSQGHPMGYANIVQSKGAYPVVSGAATAVTGIRYDVNAQGQQRALFGSTSTDHTVQDTLNLRAGYELSATSEMEARASLWRNDSTVSTDTWLRDASGHPVWSGKVSDGTNQFNILPNALAPSMGAESHRQLGLTWKTKHATAWNTSVVLTDYRIVSDPNRSAANPTPVAAMGGTGTVTRRDGTGWNTFEVQAAYTPTAGDWGGGKHALLLGLHRNQYTLMNVVNRASDWRTTETTLDQSYQGKTAITALYAQDAWRFNPALTLTGGLRYERFSAWDGAQYFAGTPPTHSAYGRRALHAVSPKLSLAWMATDDLVLKASAGKGVRFPNVDELFNGTKTGTSITFSDPSLKPEVSTALELSADKTWDQHSLRLSYFRDDSSDTILRQTDSTVTPTVSRVSNVDRVLTDGIEAVWQASSLGLKGLDLEGSFTWADAVVKQNTRNPATVGKAWLRIPRTRVSLQASYRGVDNWLFAAAWRRHSAAFSTELNLDTQHEVYGGMSSVNKLDVRASWRFAKGWDWALGVDNLLNKPSWQAHTMPQRSLHTSLSYSLK